MVAYGAARRIACALYDLFYRLGRFMLLFRTAFAYTASDVPYVCCTKFVLFLGRVLALITRPRLFFARSLPMQQATLMH